MADSALTCFGSRFYDNDSSDVDACTALTTQETGNGNYPLDRATGTSNAFMLRFGVNNDASAVWGGSVQLQYNLGGAGWNNVDASSSVIRSYDGLPTDGVACDTSILTGGSGDFDADGGAYDEVDGSAQGSSLAKSDYAEYQYCVYIIDGDVNDNDEVTFQIIVAAPDTLGMGGIVPTLTVDKGAAPQTVTPSPASEPFAVFTPAVVPGAVALTPSPATEPFAVFAPTVAQTQHPSPASESFGVFTPTVVKGGVVLTPDSATEPFAVFVPTLVAGGVALTPDPASAAWGVFTPADIWQGTALSPDPATAAFGVFAPTLDWALNPSPASAAWAATTPTILESVIATPDAAAATWSAFAPTVVGGVVVSPDAAAGVWGVFTATVVGGAVGGASLLLTMMYRRNPMWLLPLVGASVLTVLA